MQTTRSNLSLLWVFLTVNYIFCDVFSLFHGPTVNEILTGTVGGMVMDEQFLLYFGMLLELPMLMILGARFLPGQINRWANLVVAALMTLVQLGTVLMGGNTMHYLFFSAIEIATTLVIFVVAWRWQPEVETAAQAA